ncbi:MAG: hypothetical protein O2822_02625 [Chloroflexi bacterium]|nr:hypothetical protein [Chloroflexota bacterium]
MGTISIAIHVTAAAVLVGPQILMFLAVIPATWIIDDNEKLRRAVTRVVAARFGMLAGIAIVTLLVTGLYQYYVTVPESIRAAPEEYRFGSIFVIKMMVFTILVILIFVHMYRHGRRIATLSDQVIAAEDDPFSMSADALRDARFDLERARQKSFGFSLFILGASMITLWLGVALGDPTYAWTKITP